MAYNEETNRRMNENTSAMYRNTGAGGDDSRTTVLTDEERRDFTGITIDESGREHKEEKGRQSQGPLDTMPFGFGSEGSSGFKVYTFNGFGWKGKLIIAGIAIVLLAFLVFFGSLFFISFAVVAVLAGLLALLKRIF